MLVCFDGWKNVSKLKNIYLLPFIFGRILSNSIYFQMLAQSFHFWVDSNSFNSLSMVISELNFISNFPNFLHNIFCFRRIFSWPWLAFPSLSSLFDNVELRASFMQMFCSKLCNARNTRIGSSRFKMHSFTPNATKEQASNYYIISSQAWKRHLLTLWKILSTSNLGRILLDRG